MQRLNLPYGFTFPAMLVLYLCYCFRFRSGSLWQRIMWPVVTQVTYFCVDQGITIFMTRIPGYNFEALRSNTPQRFLAVCFYMFSCSIAIYLLSRVSQRQRNLPMHTQIASGIMALVCIIFAGIVFDLSPSALENEGAWLLNTVTFGFMITTIAWLLILDALASRNAENLVLQMDNQRMETEQRHADELQALYNHLRDVRHDLSNHMLAMSGLVNECDISGLAAYLEDWHAEFEADGHLTLTDFPQLDAILSAKLRQANALQTHTEVLFIVPSELPLSIVDLCSIIGNVLDNALEALIEVPHDERYLLLRANTASNMWQICIENASTGRYKREEKETFLSTKTGAWRGVGLRRTRLLVEQNNGDLLVEATDETFRVDILFPWSKRPVVAN